MLVLLVSAAAIALLPGQVGGMPGMTIHVSDSGVGQYKKGLKTGDNFGDYAVTKVNRAFPELCGGGSGCAAQIMLVMPTIDEMKVLSDAEIRNELNSRLGKAIQNARQQGHREFEIQLITDIGPTTYLNESVQRDVARWGTLAYDAIGEVYDNYTALGENVTVDATTGSNGTHMLAVNVNQWARYMSAVDMIDGRAGYDDVLRVIDALKSRNGKNTLRLFHSRYDLPGLGRFSSQALNLTVNSLIQAHTRSWPGRQVNEAQFKAAMANFGVAKQVVQAHPDTQLFLIDGPWAFSPKRSHINSMAYQFNEAPFVAEPYFLDRSSGKVLPGTPYLAFQKDLRQRTDAATRLLSASEYDAIIGGVAKRDQWVTGFDMLRRVQSQIQITSGSARIELIKTRTHLLSQMPDWLKAASAKEKDLAYGALNGLVNHWSASSTLAAEKAIFANVQTQLRAAHPAGGPGRAAAAAVGDFVLVPRVAAENLLDTVNALVGLIEHVDGLGLKKYSPRKLFGIAGADYLDFADKLNKFSKSLGEDLEAYGDGRFYLWDSKTVRWFADEGLKKALPEVFKALLASNGIKTGKLTFGLEKLIFAAADHIAEGHASIDTVTLYADAYIKFFSGVSGLLICKGNVACSQAVATAFETGLGLFRQALQPLTNKLVLWKSGNAKQLIGDWRTLQNARLANGLAPVDIDVDYDRKLLNANGINDRMIAELNEEVDRLKQIRVARYNELAQGRPRSPERESANREERDDRDDDELDDLEISPDEDREWDDDDPPPWIVRAECMLGFCDGPEDDDDGGDDDPGDDGGPPPPPPPPPPGDPPDDGGPGDPPDDGDPPDNGGPGDPPDDGGQDDPPDDGGPDDPPDDGGPDDPPDDGGPDDPPDDGGMDDPPDDGGPGDQPKPAPNGILELGGINIYLEDMSISYDGLTVLKEQALEARPDTDSLSWSFER